MNELLTKIRIAKDRRVAVNFLIVLFLVLALFVINYYDTNSNGNLGVSLSPTSVDLTWTDNSDNEDGFNIYRSIDGVNFNQIATIPTNDGPGIGGQQGYSDSVSGLTPGTAYDYQITAYNSAGESNPSNTVSVTIPNPQCGNSVINIGEQCDDGNLNSGDGCSSTCQIESGYVCPNPGFACVPQVNPVITDVQPDPADSSIENTLTITGSNFNLGLVVLLNGILQAPASVSSTIVTVNLGNLCNGPVGCVVGPLDVQVDNNPSNPGVDVSNTYSINLEVPAPAISALNPNTVDTSMIPFTLSITGSNIFQYSSFGFDGTFVKINDVQTPQTVATVYQGVADPNTGVPVLTYVSVTQPEA